MHGLVVLDENDQVIRPAILWNDGRTGEETEYLNTVIGKEKLSEYTANIAFAGFTAPKILWMKKNEPELAAELGFTENVKIIAGAGDNAAAAVGTGTVGEGMCNISLGTSGTIFISSKNFCVDSNNALHSFDHADGNYHLM